jgi:hypothetical protein
MGGIIAWITGTLVPMILNFLWGKWLEERKKQADKDSEDKKVDESTGKAKDPNLGKRLDGTKELEDGMNGHT